MAEKPPRPAAAFVSGWKPVLIVLAIYTIGFFVFYPRALTITDEALYVRQAAALAAGGTTVAVVDPLTGAETRVPAAPYPLGTALLLAPFVLAFGWQGSFVAALLALLLATLITARWVAEAPRVRQKAATRRRTAARPSPGTDGPPMEPRRLLPSMR